MRIFGGPVGADPGEEEEFEDDEDEDEDTDCDADDEAGAVGGGDGVDVGGFAGEEAVEGEGGHDESL